MHLGRDNLKVVYGVRFSSVKLSDVFCTTVGKTVTGGLTNGRVVYNLHCLDIPKTLSSLRVLIYELTLIERGVKRESRLPPK